MKLGLILEDTSANQISYHAIRNLNFATNNNNDKDNDNVISTLQCRDVNTLSENVKVGLKLKCQGLISIPYQPRKLI